MMCSSHLLSINTKHLFNIFGFSEIDISLMKWILNCNPTYKDYYEVKEAEENNAEISQFQ